MNTPSVPRDSATWMEDDQDGVVLDDNGEEDFVELEFDEAEAEECCENSVFKPVCIPIAILLLILMLFFVVPLFVRHPMKVLLLEDVDGIGHCGEVVKVNAKLAHETLIPMGKAREATALGTTPAVELHRGRGTIPSGESATTPNGTAICGTR